MTLCFGQIGGSNAGSNGVGQSLRGQMKTRMGGVGESPPSRLSVTNHTIRFLTLQVKTNGES